MAHSKRMRTELKKQRIKTLQARKKETAEKRRKRKKEVWTYNKNYQAKQEKRLVELKAKPGYEANIARGIKEKEQAKLKRSKK